MTAANADDEKRLEEIRAQHFGHEDSIADDVRWLLDKLADANENEAQLGALLAESDSENDDFRQVIRTMEKAIAECDAEIKKLFDSLQKSFISHGESIEKRDAKIAKLEAALKRIVAAGTDQTNDDFLAFIAEEALK